MASNNSIVMETEQGGTATTMVVGRNIVWL